MNVGRQLTQDGDGHSFADGRGDTVGRDALVNAHVSLGNVRNPQQFPLV